MKRTLALLTELHNDESGQGLVEYLLIVALVALAATAGMNTAASYMNSAFTRLGGASPVPAFRTFRADLASCERFGLHFPSASV